jgi:hypothetical protein
MKSNFENPEKEKVVQREPGSSGSSPLTGAV